ncbi:nudix hydrolase 13, mitochondrial [Malania oleifera]|uniref:nudix hydrolase 13, mitochondrial n=1 Tax=Malania oleifera TaxID=397392 RepID=UPI0025AE8624|nr:nudix hydrolase 13, mitochondrial [Malania oleifera]
MSSLVARTGRHRQRYENNFRLVSGCIPYKDDGDQSSDPEGRIKVLMISSPNRDDLVFPKGGWEDDETVEEAAHREAWEEAGVRGELRRKPLGVWEFRSKSKEKICSTEGRCRGYMFALKVKEEHEAWPEQENHNRKWLNIKDAFKLCRYEWMREALNEFLKVMREDRSMPISAVAAECQNASPNCSVRSSSNQQSEWLRRPMNSCMPPGPNLVAAGATQSSTQLDLKGRA